MSIIHALSTFFNELSVKPVVIRGQLKLIQQRIPAQKSHTFVKKPLMILNLMRQN